MPKEVVSIGLEIKGSVLIDLAKDFGYNDARRTLIFADDTFDVIRTRRKFQQRIPHKKKEYIFSVLEENKLGEFEWRIKKVVTNEKGAIFDAYKLYGYKERIWRRILDMSPNFLDEISDMAVAEQNKKMVGKPFAEIMMWMASGRDAEIKSDEDMILLTKWLAGKLKERKKKRGRPKKKVELKEDKKKIVPKEIKKEKKKEKKK